MTSVQPLKPADLYRVCDPDQFHFNTTADLPELTEIIGQPRAVEAIRFGTSMRRHGFNVFAIGTHGVGKYTAVTQFIEQKARAEPTPPDWCYIHNFDAPHRPHALRLPPGTGNELAADMRRLVEELLTVIPAAFEGEEYRRQRDTINHDVKTRQDATLSELKREAEERQIALITSPDGMGFVPLRHGRTISPEEYARLPSEEQERIDKDVELLQERLQDILRQVPQWQREVQHRLKALKQAITTIAVTPLFAELAAKHAGLPAVMGYLQAVQSDVIQNFDDFLEPEEGTLMQPLSRRTRIDGRENMPQRYQVNVIVDHSGTTGAPVVSETFPVYHNLIGRVEHVAQMGALLTDFTLIKPGSLHQANGGYLIIDARQLLLQPFAWEGLKHALRTAMIKIESLGQIYSTISTVSLEPEPIALDVKVVLLGEPMLYYLLCAYDPDFTELFKVSADFEYDMPRTPENNDYYARLVGTLARKEALRPFSRHAVARLLEHSSRLAGDATRLTTHMQSVADILREADFWAGEMGDSVIAVDHIEKAIDAQVRRQNRLQERAQQAILRDIVLIMTDGTAVGQINGLSVIQLGTYAFGRPSRITARVRLGKGEVIDIERQVELGGPTHSKGVLILAGFLAARYAADRPFALSATLAFEQSYGGVDGDSASSAELYCLLSALAQLPLQQGLAVTGSVNQHGEVQAIGGVNEKIEGFFDICAARGLTGRQGVLIPRANVQHLMLRRDVVQAVADGLFHIYPVATVDDGIALLTGVAAGAPDDAGRYAADTVNGRVVARLEALADRQKALLRARNGHMAGGVALAE